MDSPQQEGSDGALGAVLAGGLGSRLGGDKATVELGGEPLIARPLAALAAAGLEAVVVAKPETELPPLRVPVVREPEQPVHPLCGIVAALEHADGRPVLALACDLPFLDPLLLAWLAWLPDPLAVPAPGGEPQPLVARYGPTLLAPLKLALERGEPLRRTVESLRPRLVGNPELARFGDPARLFFNVNDAADLERARQILRFGPSRSG